MALIDIDKDPWITEYESCERLHRDIVDLLNNRSVELKTSDTYAHLSNSVRIRLKQYDTEVQQLRIKLRELALSRTVTLDEAERRERLLENLKTNIIQLQRRFNDRDSITTSNRSKLLNERSTNKSSSDYNVLKHSENTSNLSGDFVTIIPEGYVAEQLKSQRQQVLKDQDDGLEQLAQSISRQKNIALKIEREVDDHNDIIDDICNKMDRTSGGLQQETANIVLITKKSSTWSYWLIIIVLLIAIIIVIAI